MDNIKATQIADQLLRLRSRTEFQLAPAAARLIATTRPPVRQHFQRTLVASAVPLIASVERLLYADVSVELSDLQRTLAATMVLVTPASIIEMKISAEQRDDPAYTIDSATSEARAWRLSDIETVEYTSLDAPSAEDPDEPWEADGVLKVVMRSNRLFRFSAYETNSQSLVDLGALLMA